MNDPIISHSRSPTILIIDDDPSNLAIVAEYLEDHSLRILVAEDGESGVKKAGYAQPDLILLDVLMPGIDGYETCRRLKALESTKDIPVIFMTALGETEHKARGFEAGAVDYIVKPFQREEVLARVGVHLRIRQLVTRLQEAKGSLEKRVEERTVELERANRELQAEISERKRAKEELQHAHDTLEQRVRNRTAELAASNELLRREIEERGRVEETLRETERQRRHLSFELVKAQESERKRIANMIHDSIGQSLHAIKIGLAGLVHQEDAMAKRATSFKDLLRLIDFAIEEVRNIYTDLRPSLIDDLGILAATRWFLREFRKTYPDIRIEERIGIREDEVPEPIKIVIFRVLQAALDNIARHSEATSVCLSLAGKNGGIQLVIQDSGVGFNLQNGSFEMEGKLGLGLATMQEQVESSGGIFTIKSIKGAGTTIHALWSYK